MRRTIALLAAGVLLVGCGAKADLGAQPVASETSTSAAALPEAQYLELVRGLPHVSATIDDATLVRIADNACKLLVGEAIHGPLNDPLTWKQWKTVIRTMTDNGFPAEQAGQLVVFAVSFKCPEKMAEYLPPA